MKKRFGIALSGLMVLVGAVGAAAAESKAANPMQGRMEMMKNVTWTVEGLQKLGNSKDRTLKLTKAQSRKILPIYQELVAKNIIQLKLEQPKGAPPAFPGPGSGGPRPNGNGNPKGGPPDVKPGDDQKRREERMHEREALISFGNAKMEAINRILTKKQVGFIDNLDFDPEKYGFPKLGRSKNNFGGGPQVGGNRPGFNRPGGRRQRPNREPRTANPKLEKGRKELIKLNNEVLKLLQKMR